MIKPLSKRKDRTYFIPAIRFGISNIAFVKSIAKIPKEFGYELYFGTLNEYKKLHSHKC